MSVLALHLSAEGTAEQKSLQLLRTYHVPNGDSFTHSTTRHSSLPYLNTHTNTRTHKIILAETSASFLKLPISHQALHSSIPVSSPTKPQQLSFCVRNPVAQLACILRSATQRVSPNSPHSMGSAASVSPSQQTVSIVTYKQSRKRCHQTQTLLRTPHLRSFNKL